MKKCIAILGVVMLLAALVTGCKKDPEIFQSATLNDYYPLETGKTYLYRMDSTIATSAGAALVVHSYHAMDSIESAFTDNEGRPSYRIFRFTRDTADTQGWQFASTYFATIAADHIEYVDNNLRFIKLHLPFTEDYTFAAHSFINTTSDPNVYLNGWEYVYQNVEHSYTLPYGEYNNTVTVLQRDESTPDGPFVASGYYQRNFGVEVYAKGVGLIFKDFLHYTWQPATGSSAGYYENEAGKDVSFGLRLQLISHH